MLSDFLAVDGRYDMDSEWLLTQVARVTCIEGWATVAVSFRHFQSICDPSRRPVISVNTNKFGPRCIHDTYLG